MNKTLTKISPLLMLALVMSACSSAPKTKETTNVLDGITQADLFADRMISTLGEGGIVVARAIETLVMAGKNDAALAVMASAERLMGIKAGSMNLANYKSLLDSQEHPISKETALKSLIPYKAELAAANNKEITLQIEAAQRVGKYANSNIPMTANTEQTVAAIEMLKRQRSAVAHDEFALTSAFNGEANILDMDVASIQGTCETLDTGSAEGMSVKAADNYETIHKEVTESMLEVKANSAVSAENAAACAVEVGAANNLNRLSRFLNHASNRLKEVMKQSAQSCKLTGQRLLAAANMFSAQQVAQLATIDLKAPSNKGWYVNQLPHCH